MFTSNPTLFYYFRCYADELANKSIAEIRDIYSKYPDPSCTKYRGDSSLASIGSYNNDSEHCDRWFYELDHGYKSMSSEVNNTFSNELSSFFFH